MTFSIVLQRLVLTTYLLFVSAGGPHAQTLSNADIRSLFTNRTTFGYVNADRESWNAYFSADGRAVYWGRDFRITKGHWRIASGQLCVSLNTSECRIPSVRQDGIIDWINPSTGRPTSTFVRLETGDVFGLLAQRNGSIYRPAPTYDGELSRFSPDIRWVQTHSFRDLFEAETKTIEMRSRGFRHAVITSARNGWHAVVLGTLSPERLDIFETWKLQGKIPADSVLTKGTSYFSFVSPNENRIARKETNKNESSAAESVQCTQKQYDERRLACRRVFAGELACTKIFSGEFFEVSPRSAKNALGCSVAAQILFEGGINLKSTGISLMAGILDDVGEELQASEDEFLSAFGYLLEDASVGTSVGGLAYCLNQVEEGCGH